jgi:hypothetical protein
VVAADLAGGERGEQDGRAAHPGQLLWQFLNGAVNLRISRPLFPWPPLKETVTAMVDRIIGSQA